MQRIDPATCEVHVLVCVNARSGSSMPCCADQYGPEVWAQLRRWVARHGLLTRVWVTQTGCLGWCSDGGATVFVYPEAAMYRSVSPDDCDAIIEQHLRPLLPD